MVDPARIIVSLLNLRAEVANGVSDRMARNEVLLKINSCLYEEYPPASALDGPPALAEDGSTYVLMYRTDVLTTALNKDTLKRIVEQQVGAVDLDWEEHNSHGEYWQVGPVHDSSHNHHALEGFGVQMIIAFTGTREGMTTAQKETVYTLLAQHMPDAVVHGDCIGADADFHTLAELYATRFSAPLKFIIRPGCNRHGAQPTRAFSRTELPGCEYAMHPAEYYLVRDKKIVGDGDLLIATPRRFDEEQRSGTWTTVRAAAKLHKSIQIVYPDGRIGEYQSAEELSELMINPQGDRPPI